MHLINVTRKHQLLQTQFLAVKTAVINNLWQQIVIGSIWNCLSINARIDATKWVARQKHVLEVQRKLIFELVRLLMNSLEVKEYEGSEHYEALAVLNLLLIRFPLGNRCVKSYTRNTFPMKSAALYLRGGLQWCKSHKEALIEIRSSWMLTSYRENLLVFAIHLYPFC